MGPRWFAGKNIIMTSPSAFRRSRTILAVAALLLTASARLSADLVWSQSTGWHVEGGVLAGLGNQGGHNALDIMNKARESEEAGHAKHAIKLYEKVGKKYPNSVYAPEAFWRAGNLQLAAKKYIKAFTDYQQIVGRYPNTARFNDVIGQQYRIASALLDGARGHVLGIFPTFTNREASVGQFELIVRNAPYSDYAPLALLNEARGLQYLNEPEEAIDALDRMINNYPQSLLAPEAYLRLAEAHAQLVEGPYYDQEATRNAITYFQDFMILFPNDSGVPAADKGLGNMKTTLADSKLRLGDFYFYRRQNYKAARVFYNEAITSYPDSLIASKAKERIVKVDAAQAQAEKIGPRHKKSHFWFF